MHGSVRDGLEYLLVAKSSAMASEQAADHLNDCSECVREFNEFRAQSELFSSLRSPEDVEPSPGFYARVIQRIEQGARRSIWWMLAYSPSGKRLAYVSFATALILGSYVVARENLDGSLLHRETFVASHYEIPIAGSADQQRDAVLQNFASHSGTRQ